MRKRRQCASASVQSVPLALFYINLYQFMLWVLCEGLNHSLMSDLLARKAKISRYKMIGYYQNFIHLTNRTSSLPTASSRDGAEQQIFREHSHTDHI